MINRLGKENVKKMIGSYPVVVLLGPRGSGKKTIANGFSKKCFNIENDDEVYRLDYLWEDQIEKDELTFLEDCKKLISDGKKPDELKKKYSKDLIKKSALLSLKPRIIVCNVDEKSLPNGNKYLSLIHI